MGMYDNFLISTDKLPISDIEKSNIKSNNVDWQTKSLGRDLYNYRVTKKNNLKLNDNTKLKFTGVIRFYSNVGDWQSDYDWYEFSATFTNGKLIAIVGGKKN